MITKINLEKGFELFFTFPDTCLRRTTQIEKTGHFPNLGQNGRFLHFSLRISAVILLVLGQNFRDLENALQSKPPRDMAAKQGPRSNLSIYLTIWTHKLLRFFPTHIKIFLGFDQPAFASTEFSRRISEGNSHQSKAMVSKLQVHVYQRALVV